MKKKASGFVTLSKRDFDKLIKAIKSCSYDEDVYANVDVIVVMMRMYTPMLTL